ESVEAVDLGAAEKAFGEVGHENAGAALIAAELGDHAGLDLVEKEFEQHEDVHQLEAGDDGARAGELVGMTEIRVVVAQLADVAAFQAGAAQVAFEGIASFARRSIDSINVVEEI